MPTERGGARRGVRELGAGERPERRPTAADGVLVVDKPAGWTSHDVVARLRRLAATRKVGHAGTLDPMATGVLVVGVGRATRLLAYLTGADKAYDATIRLGASTVTDDAEGEVTAVADASGVGRDRVEAAVRALTGDLLQVPAAVSAVKVDGRRAYARVRAGEAVELAARPVRVSRFDVLDVRPVTGPAGGTGGAGLPALDVDVAVECSSGTYVRALARDLGAALGVGGHLTALRRTRVGGFGLDAARTLDELAAEPADGPLPVLALADAARATFPVRALTADEAVALGHGRPVRALPGEGPGAPPGEGPGAPHGDGPGTLAAVGPDGTLVALVEPHAGALRPVVVFAPA